MDPFIKSVMQQMRSFTPKYCDNCGFAHSEKDFSFVGNKEGMLTFQVGCSNCGSMDVIQMSPNQPGLNIKRYNTFNSDVKGAELAKFAGKDQLSKSEILDVYDKVKSVSSLEDLKKLLGGSATSKIKA